ncbi:MAG: hypothetical protein ACYTHJ_17520 [Planctomycetota bacterium]|jgi:hypothetical protein
MKNHSRRTVWAVILAMLAAANVTAMARQADEAGIEIRLGVQAYLQGRNARSQLEHRRNPEIYYQRSLEHLGRALELEPRNRVAMLFRALVYGEMGLLERGIQITLQDQINAADNALQFKIDPDARSALLREREELTTQLEQDAALPAPERVRLTTRIDWIDVNLQEADALEDESEASLRSQLDTGRMDLHESAGRARTHYRAMLDDLGNLIDASDSPENILKLLEVVARTKISRFDEQEAQRGTDGIIPESAMSAPAIELRKASFDALDEVRIILEGILADGTATGMDLVRARFFLGVILYRQGIPRQVDGEETRNEDLGKLLKAEEVMKVLAEDNEVERSWRSFASLYLGLIIPFRAAEERDTNVRSEILDEAAYWLQVAAELDVKIPESGVEDASSRTGFIPDVRWDQDKEIEKLREAPSFESMPINDISLTLYTGAERDTNVPLIGERADLPRGISDKEDYGFSTGALLGYTLDLTDKWTLGIEGRASSLWHCDLDEFDEQNYGGSAALQYELMPMEGATGPVQLRMQYDYDYTLLGREGFLSANRLTPNLRVYWNDQLFEFNLYYTYEIRDYFEDLTDRRTDRSGQYHSIGFANRFKTIDMTPVYESWGLEPWGHKNDHEFIQDGSDYPQRYLEPFFAVQYSWDQTDGTEFDQWAIDFLVGTKFPLPYGIDLLASADFEWEEYRNGSVIDFHRRRRSDFIQEYRVEMTRTFILVPGVPENRFRPAMDRVLMTLAGHATFTHDDSNIDDRLGQSVFEYDRTIFGFSVAFSFN